MTLLSPPTAPARPARETRPAPWTPSLGAWVGPEGGHFRLWASKASRVEVVVEKDGGVSRYPLQAAGGGVFEGVVPGLRPGALYKLSPDGRGPFPDPASRFQPEGVHGPSELIDPAAFAWSASESGWKGVAPDAVVVYELHVGTFSPEGTFEGVTKRLEYLRDLGVTAVELLPIAEFAGARSWGYDGVGFFAPSHNYGRPDDLRRLVDTAHALGLAVFLDVVYNHFGPVGNYALEFSPEYLSSTHSSAWAACVNLDGPGSDQARAFFIENACHWVHEYHLDGLRLDATHALIDGDARPLVAELVEAVKRSVPGRNVLIVAEDHRNRADMLWPPGEGGWGLDGVWADDLHHEVRRKVAGDHEGYYADYTGTTADLARTINQGWFYTGQFSEHLKEHRGTDPAGLPPRKFVVCLQNHDQVGNRALGDRLHHQIDAASFRAASALLLTLPQTPLLFMGQEWASSSPFQYFTDHEPELGKIVTAGRRKEFAHFSAFQDEANRERIPDPQDPATFERSRLDWAETDREPHAAHLRLYRALLSLRRDEPALGVNEPGSFRATAPDPDTLLLRRDAPDGHSLWTAVRLAGAGRVALPADDGPRRSSWEVVLTTEDAAFAPQAAPPVIDLSGQAPVVDFAGPAAVLLRRKLTPPGVWRRLARFFRGAVN